MVTVDGLSVKRSGRDVLRGVSMAFEARTVSAIVGPSGVGKSTLIAALNGLLRPSAGSISVAGIGALSSADALRQARRNVATVFQEHALIERLSALDNVLLGLADQRHPLTPWSWPRSLRERAAIALAEVGLLGKANRRVRELSGGEQQRVGIARALVRRPLLLLGDEPFAAVDPRLTYSLAEDLRTLVDLTGLTVVLVLHQLQVARAFADHIVGLSQGRVVFDGPAAAFDALAEQRVFGA